MIIFGGVGLGKFCDLYLYVVCNLLGECMVFMDLCGELVVILMVVYVMYGEYVYCWNLMGIVGLLSYGCNLLDILDVCLFYFYFDCKFIVESFVQFFGVFNGQYFELWVCEWLEGLIKFLVECYGYVIFFMFFCIINMIEGDFKNWVDFLLGMLVLIYDFVCCFVGEMLVKQQDSFKEFGFIFGEIYVYIVFFGDFVLLFFLEKDDFLLLVLIDLCWVIKMFFNVLVEYLCLWFLVFRLMFIVIMFYKVWMLDGLCVLFCVDEVGQFGCFEVFLCVFIFGCGVGICVWVVFQDIGQIVCNFD